MDVCEIRSMEHRRPIGHKWVEAGKPQRVCVACLAIEENQPADDPDRRVQEAIDAIWNA